MGTIEKYANILKKIDRNLDSIEKFQTKMSKQREADNLLLPLFLKESEYVNKLKSLLKVRDVDGKNYTRVGSSADGGYVMVDDLDKISKVYSIGIGDDISFDSFFSDKKTNVYMYDHTIEDIPVHNEFLHWWPIGVCGEKNSFDNMKTLDEIIHDNCHDNEKGMILKMDIEGYEWEVLKNISCETLNAFDQIVMELHGMHNLGHKDKIVQGIENINKTHQLVHVHANNWGAVVNIDGWILPDLLEVTFVNKNNYRFKDSKRFFPTDLDERNVEQLPEVPLGYYN